MSFMNSDANTARLEKIEEEFDELNERCEAQRTRRAEHIFDRIGGDPSKMLEDRVPQAWSIAWEEAEDDEALRLADEVEEEIATIKATLARVGPPAYGLFQAAWAASKAYRQHLNAADGPESGDQDWDD